MCSNFYEIIVPHSTISRDIVELRDDYRGQFTQKDKIHRIASIKTALGKFTQTFDCAEKKCRENKFIS